MNASNTLLLRCRQLILLSLVVVLFCELVSAERELKRFSNFHAAAPELSLERRMLVEGLLNKRMMAVNLGGRVLEEGDEMKDETLRDDETAAIFLSSGQYLQSRSLLLPRLFLQSPYSLRSVAQFAAQRQPEFLDWLASDAATAMSKPTVGIWDTMQGPKYYGWEWNDFVSLGPYWWPDPKANGG